VSTTRGRAAPMSPDARRRAIVEAVIPLLVSQGANVTTRQIAAAAGVAEGTLFRVFPDKAALMHAAAHATMDPAGGHAALTEIDAGLDLHGTVQALTEHLLRRMEQIIAVMMAVRSFGPPHEHDGRRPDGPPAFMVEANRALLAALTEVLARYRDELRVPPERAALVLRSMVFGCRHPGTAQADRLTAEEIAAVLVSGLARCPDRAPENTEVR
jgi:AcrR family transcriptional regulator